MSQAHAFRPRSLVHRGTVAARAVLVGDHLCGESTARRRVLRLWRPGTAVHRLPEGWLVVLPAATALPAANAPGTLFVESAEALVAFPSTGPGQPRLQPGGAALYRGGVMVTEPVDRASVVSPADWLDLRGYAVAEAESLGGPIPPPDGSQSFQPAGPFDARAQLAGVPAAAPERARLLARLEDAGRRRDGGARAGTSLLGTLLRAIVPALTRAWNGAKAGAAASGAAPPSAGTGWMSRLGDFFHHIGARLMMLTRLSAVVGRRQAEYLARLVDMLERGDLDEGLRHAIPVGGPEGERLRVALRTPTPRTTLGIDPASHPATSAIGMGEDFTAYLRKLYRTSYEMLAAQGRIDEAAFVLAELLHANEEAVAFLERHGRLQLAAEMAEARKLEPELVVRQWFVAGRPDRAVEIARRKAAFAGAVLRLEQQQRHRDAAALRLLWADALAEVGEYRAAVDVVWTVPEGRRLAVAWMDRVIEQGGPAGAAMLARRVILDPASFPEARAAVAAIVEDEAADGVPTRLALATALAEPPHTLPRATLARAAARAALRDFALFGTGLRGETLHKLAALDGALRTDLPLLPKVEREPLFRQPQRLAISIAAGDAGTLDVRDAGLLPNGQMVVALGEAGVMLRSRENRLVARFDVPADRLVLSDAGDRAIALARRGAAWRLSRLDLVRRTAEDWCDAKIDAFAPTYDGARWFVCTGDLWAIDVRGSRFDGAWGVPGLTSLGEEVVIARSGACCAVYVPEEHQLWSYEMPALVLRSRRGLPAEPVAVRAVSAKGMAAGHGGERPSFVAWTSSDAWRHRALARPEERPGPVALDEAWMAAAWIAPAGVRVEIHHTGTGTFCAEMQLAGATRVALRFMADVLVVADDRGRLLALDLDYGWLARDVRL